MDANSQRRKHQGGALSSLNAAVEATNVAEERAGIAPVKVAFGSVSALLATIRDSMIKKVDYIELGLACADVCGALDRGVNGRGEDQISQSVLEAIERLTTTVTEVKRNVDELSKRNRISRLFHAKDDKETIAAWRLDLNRILHVFNTELAINTHVIVSDVQRDVLNTHTIVSDVHQGVTNTHAVVANICSDVANTHAVVSDVHQGVANTHAIVSELQHSVTNTHTIVSDIHRTIAKGQEASNDKDRLVQPSALGESPPPPPRACFGRQELVDNIVDLAEHFTPIALIGAGGIGKTSIALTVLHDDRIKEHFGPNRRFIRCDQFPASLPHFLRRLSHVIGAGVENPEDLAPLRPFLSSRQMILFLDNAESILDPQGTDARKIYDVVVELSHFSNICLGITSRISTVPPHCKRPVISTLSMESACDIFYGIYDNGGRSDIINDLVRRLDFHALSVTLLATVASHNMWDYDRLSREWDAHRTQVLRTDYDESLAATIELSLASPTFRKLGPDARDLLGVAAFFPQGIDENLDWLFPTIPDKKNMFDKFCVLSLAYRSNGFVTMLAPLRDYLCPKGPEFSPLLHTTKDHYFRKLSVKTGPGKPGFEEARWITSEDVNVEHLVDVFTSVDANSDDVWPACANFMEHLLWHKNRLVVLGPKIERLPDNHPSKPGCLFELSRSFASVENHVETRRVCIHILKLWRERGNDLKVAQSLRLLSDANRQLGLSKEGIAQVKEALEIYERHNRVLGQAQCLRILARLLNSDNQLDAAETAGSQAIDLSSKINNQLEIYHCHRALGHIHRCKGEIEKAISHFKSALEIASSLNWDNQLFWCHHTLAKLFYCQGRLDDARVHIEHTKLYLGDNPHNLGRAMGLQALCWCKERRFEEAKSEVLRAVDILERVGATKDLEWCRAILRDIEEGMKEPVTSGE